MKRFLSIACVLVLALTCGLTANAKKKEVCFQMYSVRDLIGNPEKYAQNHEKTLKELADMGYTAVEAACYDNGKCVFSAADFLKEGTSGLNMPKVNCPQNNTMYDLQGKKRSSIKKGEIFIRNGKKYINRSI